MTPDEQNKRIAEWCGWRVARESDGEFSLLNPNGEKLSSHWETGTTLDWFVDIMPYYATDLNDVREAINRLPIDHQHEYNYNLTCVLKLNPFRPPDPEELFTLLNATAAQRAEALLRTIGRWEDK